MKTKQISFIIPVYNRPDEIQELLSSFQYLEGDKSFEIVIVEDGSKISSEDVIKDFDESLNISYYYKENSGPGDSRNYGMQKAKGDYFIILDSDCILPTNYLTEAIRSLNENFVDCFGGPDAAHDSFTNLQKAINFSMTSFLTTGGIRGRKDSVDKFQPRSFNMGLSKKAFETTNGFGRIHPGEDPDLSIRLEKLGFKTALYPKVKVFHKRRISWSKFYNQVYKFGSVRAILNKWHPGTKKITYWFPSVFVVGLVIAFLMALLGVKWLLIAYAIYFVICLINALFQTSNLVVSCLVVPAILIQFTGYGYGFIKSQMKLLFSNKSDEETFPKLFFKSR